MNRQELEKELRSSYGDHPMASYYTRKVMGIVDRYTAELIHAPDQGLEERITRTTDRLGERLERLEEMNEVNPTKEEFDVLLANRRMDTPRNDLDLLTLENRNIRNDLEDIYNKVDTLNSTLDAIADLIQGRSIT